MGPLYIIYVCPCTIGESRRAKRLRRANRLRAGLGDLADPGGQEPDERRRADREGLLRGEHQVPQDEGGGRHQGRQPRRRVEDEGEEGEETIQHHR